VWWLRARVWLCVFVRACVYWVYWVHWVFCVYWVHACTGRLGVLTWRPPHTHTKCCRCCRPRGSRLSSVPQFSYCRVTSPLKLINSSGRPWIGQNRGLITLAKPRINYKYIVGKKRPKTGPKTGESASKNAAARAGADPLGSSLTALRVYHARIRHQHAHYDDDDIGMMWHQCRLQYCTLNPQSCRLLGHGSWAAIAVPGSAKQMAY
jgi:hypothetical protein